MPRFRLRGDVAFRDGGVITPGHTGDTFDLGAELSAEPSRVLTVSDAVAERLASLTAADGGPLLIDLEESPVAIEASRITVATTATLLQPATPTFDRAGVLLKNMTGTATVYLGGSDVTTATGFPWETGDGPLAVDMSAGEELYGIVASGTQTVASIQQGT